MTVKNLLKGLRNELNNVIEKHLTNDANFNSIVTVENLDKYSSFLKEICFTTKYGNTVIFTNGNSWYMDTLIRNLVVSFKHHKEHKDYPFGVISSDEEGYSKAKKEYKHSFLIKIPLLKVDNLMTVKQPEDYTRLCFVKTALIYHALKFGYTVLYIDPDQSFIKPSVSYLLDKIGEYGLVLAGIKEGNMNTNIIGVQPTSNNISIFELDYKTFEANLLNKRLYNRWSMSDEEFIIMKDGYDPDKIIHLDVKLFPPGSLIKDNRETAMVVHANCVSGLDNKIAFMKEYKGWFLQ